MILENSIRDLLIVYSPAPLTHFKQLCRGFHLLYCVWQNVGQHACVSRANASVQSATRANRQTNMHANTQTRHRHHHNAYRPCATRSWTQFEMQASHGRRHQRARRTCRCTAHSFKTTRRCTATCPVTRYIDGATVAPRCILRV